MARTSFGIGQSLRQQAMIMRMLRDSIYTDKFLAVLREYAANGWDAHRMVGKHDVPILVQLPTSLNPVLKIRDYGPGLSHEDVFEKYTKYGETSKLDTNDEVGMFGVGCKSGFAYSTSFVVTSWFNGKKRVYTASLGKDDLGDLTLDYEGDCGDETGIEIRIAVKPKDVRTFHQKAKYLFRYFDPFPVLHYGDGGKEERGDDYPEISPASSPFKHGSTVSSGVHTWVAVMGCIPYRIDMSQMQDALDARNLTPFVENQSGALFFPIGGIDFNAAREEVEYTETTIRSIVNKIRLFRREVSESMVSVVEGASDSRTRRHAVRRMVTLGLTPPHGYAHLAASNVRLHLPRDGSTIPNPKNLVEAPKEFKIGLVTYRAVQEHEFAEAGRDPVFYIRDTGHPMVGYSLDIEQHRVILSPNGRHFEESEIPAIEEMVQEMLAGCEMDGHEVKRLSTREYDDWRTSRQRDLVDTSKYFVKSFRLDNTDKKPLSNRWVIEDREPTDDDVYVIINRFEAVDGYDIYRQVEWASTLSEELGEEMPIIYGYKDTQKEPVNRDELKGISFREWEKGLIERLAAKDPSIKQLALANRWANVFRLGYRYRSDPKAVLHMVEDKLGKDHPITFMFRRKVWGREHLRDAMSKASIPLKKQIIQHIIRLQEEHRSTGYRCPATACREKLDKQYPLIWRGGGWEVLGDDSHTDWYDYIEMIDNKEHSDE